MLRKINNPILFQGNPKKKNYFEGWYYKQVSQDKRSAISFIPGISLFENESHSFIQYIFISLDEDNQRVVKTGYVRFPVKDFKFKENPFMIKIGDNIFSESMVDIKLFDDRVNINGTIKLGDLKPIKSSILAPNIMGPFAYFPKMECYHGIISMNHNIGGTLRFNDKKINFNNGNGYIEKDWGTSFPKKYIWIQCNNFKDKTTSVVFSVAKIPFLNTYFRGFICNLSAQGKEYRFATYNKSTLKIKNINEKGAMLILENNEAVLKINAVIRETGGLMAPKQGEMQVDINEELSGEVSIYLYHKESRMLYEDIGCMAGIEIVGF